jgi:hypothetical protein
MVDLPKLLTKCNAKSLLLFSSISDGFSDEFKIYNFLNLKQNNRRIKVFASRLLDTEWWLTVSSLTYSLQGKE